MAEPSNKNSYVIPLRQDWEMTNALLCVWHSKATAMRKVFTDIVETDKPIDAQVLREDLKALREFQQAVASFFGEEPFIPTDERTFYTCRDAVKQLTRSLGGSTTQDEILDNLRGIFRTPIEEDDIHIRKSMESLSIRVLDYIIDCCHRDQVEAKREGRIIERSRNDVATLSTALAHHSKNNITKWVAYLNEVSQSSSQGWKEENVDDLLQAMDKVVVLQVALKEYHGESSSLPATAHEIENWARFIAGVAAKGIWGEDLLSAFTEFMHHCILLAE